MKKKTTARRPLTSKQVGVKYGFRSGLEEKVADFLRDQGVSFTYEDRVIKYEKPAKVARYTPDFNLRNGIIIETKGRFLTADRQKHLLVKNQHPDLDIRFLFSNSKTRISKQSKTTYADWCQKHGFIYADGPEVPAEWLIEEHS
jgi:hypothetical protein